MSDGVLLKFFMFVVGLTLLLNAYNIYENTSRLGELSLSVGSMSDDFKYFWYAVERLEMYNRSIGRWVRPNGVYFSDSYFCVWTRDRSADEINATFCHESCHHFVYEDYDHFCQEPARKRGYT